MHCTITANDIKTKGISIADNFAKAGLETIVTVRGKKKYVILTTEQYNQLKDHELTNALAEAKEDLKNGNYREDSIDKHLKRIDNA